MLVPLLVALAGYSLVWPQSPTQPPAQSPPPIRAAVITGANNHEWEWTSNEVAASLGETGRFEVEVVKDPATWLADAPARAQRGELHVLVLDYNGPRWGDAAEQGFVRAVQGGVGVTVLHAANNARSSSACCGGKAPATVRTTCSTSSSSTAPTRSRTAWPT
jgi:hypothetical protein